MWFKKQKKPFIPISFDQLQTLTLPELKRYQKAHAKDAEDRLREIQERSAAQVQAIQEQSAAQERATQERIQQNREETERTLREIAEQGREHMTKQQEESTNLMQRAFSSPEYLAALRKALEPQPPSAPQLGNEQMIKGEILSVEEISTLKEDTHD